MDSARIASCLGKKKIFLFIDIFGLNCNPKLDFILDVSEISCVKRERKMDGSESDVFVVVKGTVVVISNDPLFKKEGHVRFTILSLNLYLKNNLEDFVIFQLEKCAVLIIPSIVHRTCLF